ncbi:nucleotidyltransferase domain-containing protein [Actinocatenispora sera]|uniref:nucleotidyltransferase domain-containing protein n=1 Tax=Actinocatenispora sera TaxID=390989 RepID=UPI00316AE224
MRDSVPTLAAGCDISGRLGGPSRSPPNRPATRLYPVRPPHSLPLERHREEKPMHVLLSGVVGSTAYGLAGPGSDIDRLGVFAVPTVELHGLRRPTESVVTTAPDVTMHEAAKWCRLALNANPTATELLWLPAELYEVRTELGERLIAIRAAFLSAPRVRDAYLGYATRRLRALSGAGPVPAADRGRVRRREAKHARHLARPVAQGEELYRTGTVRIRLADPAGVRAFGERVADGDRAAARRLVDRARETLDTARSALPDRPDEPAVERWLRSVRAARWTEGVA